MNCCFLLATGYMKNMGYMSGWNSVPLQNGNTHHK